MAQPIRHVNMGYVLTINAIRETRFYRPDGLFSFFKSDANVLAEVALAAVTEGAMDITVTYLGDEVRVSRVLVSGPVPASGALAFSTYRDRADLEYRGVE